MRPGFVFSSLTAISLVFAAPAFAQQNSPTMPSQGTMPQTQMPAQGHTQSGHMATSGQAKKEKLSEKDKNFAKEAAMGGMAEVELGKLAQKNAQDDEVKQFGARMEQDHGAANQQLTTILAGKEFTMPQQLDEKQRKTLDRLSKVRGAEFDRAYMHDMVQDHDQDVKKFRQEAEHGRDADLKTFAQKTLQVLEQHQKLAHEISGSLTAVGSSHPAQGHKNR